MKIELRWTKRQEQEVVDAIAEKRWVKSGRLENHKNREKIMKLFGKVTGTVVERRWVKNDRLESHKKIEKIVKLFGEVLVIR